MKEDSVWQAVVQNLRDAGCDEETVERFLALEAAGDRREQLRLLDSWNWHENHSFSCCPVAVFLISRAFAF